MLRAGNNEAGAHATIELVVVFVSLSALFLLSL